MDKKKVQLFEQLRPLISKMYPWATYAPVEELGEVRVDNLLIESVRRKDYILLNWNTIKLKKKLADKEYFLSLIDQVKSYYKL